MVQDDKPPNSSDDFDARLSDLRARRPKAEEGPSIGRSQASKGYKIVAEFVSGVLVGLALGWGFDRLFGTKPWGLLGFFALGLAAGFYNVVRAGLAMTASHDTKTEE